MSDQSGISVVRLDGTIRLTQARSDGGRLEMSLTRGAERSSAVYAFTGFCGRLLVMSARSWGNQGHEPELARQMSDALTHADV